MSVVAIAPPVDGRQSAHAAAVQRGVGRLLRAYGFAMVTELPLGTGRRADVVGLGPAGEIWIVEVKSSTRVKEHHLDDCAIQAWALQQLGLPIRQVAVAHIDNAFVYQGDGGYEGLFAEADVTEQAYERIGAWPDLVERARATLARLDEPMIDVGPQCRSPYACPFQRHCGPAEEKHPAAETTRMAPGLREFANALGYPRYYLDFETVGFAVPIWKGTRPYEALPFQWSCHIDAGSRQPLLHREFLDSSGEPPMRRCAETLIEVLGAAGPVLMYTGYERRVINELAARYPDLEASLHAIRERLIDLHPVTKQHYYHPAMLGSWSIKAVLPTIAADLRYDSLGEVQDGLGAQSAFLEAIGPGTTAARRGKLRQDLLDYCRHDTLAMVRLVEFFAGSPG